VGAVNIYLKMAEKSESKAEKPERADSREGSGKASYHHGNLRPALIEAGLELAREGGPEAVLVREASRRVGVSHNAAYRHFPGRDELLKAVGARCMTELARLMEKRIDEVDEAGDAIEVAVRRLRATGSAYVQFALSEPGLFRTAFSVPHQLAPFGPAEGVGDSGLGPYGLLSAQLDGLEAAGGMDPKRRPFAETTAWSAVHGFSMLVLDGPLRAFPDAERQAALTQLLDTLDRGWLPD
jgi:AcrR family transcriptional regulator